MAGLLILFVAGLFASGAEAAEVVLLRSEATAAFFRANGGDYERLLQPWRAFFARKGITAAEVPAAKLAAMKGPATLLLASAVALGPDEKEAVRSRLAAGWSVLGTWASGARDGAAVWQGYGFIEEVFESHVSRDDAEPAGEAFLLPVGETPLTHPLPAGRRLPLHITSEPFLRVKSAHVAARIGNYSRDPAPPDEDAGVVTFSVRNGARRAFLGFSETSWDGAQPQIDALLAATFDWLARRPILFKSAWPRPYQAALLVEMDTESKFENSLRMAQHLEHFGLQGTFYCVSSDASAQGELVRRLAARHEIGFHGDRHDPFGEQPAAVQDARVRTMIAEMRALLPSGHRLTGFRAPIESYDAVTERTLRAHGLTHVVASQDARPDAMPGFSPEDGGPERLVILPRTWPDDIGLLADGGAVDWLARLEDTLNLRALGVLSVHTQNFADGSPIERLVPKVLERAAAHHDTLWTAPAAAIEQWWRERDAVRVDAKAEPDGMRIRLTAPLGATSRFSLVVVPPTDAAPRLALAPRGTRLEKIDDQRWAVRFTEVRRGDSELRITY